MKDISQLISTNCQLLAQSVEMIEMISSEAYTQRESPLYASSVGEHLRHVVEHYQMFLSGVESGVADYDARIRDLRISTDPAFAKWTIHQVGLALEHMPSSDKPVSVRLASSHDGSHPMIVSDSSLCRELQYLQAHTVHHFALIAMILRLQGMELATDFGVASSTIAHKESQLSSSN